MIQVGEYVSIVRGPEAGEVGKVVRARDKQIYNGSTFVKEERILTVISTDGMVTVQVREEECVPLPQEDLLEVTNLEKFYARHGISKLDFNDQGWFITFQDGTLHLSINEYGNVDAEVKESD